MPEAVELLQCPSCLTEVRGSRRARCPACRAPVATAPRPLPLLERELQARIEAKTAPRRRQRRQAAKVARRIAALPPTIFGRDAVGTIEAEPAPPAPAPAAHTVIDLPAEAVLAVRSTSVLAEVAGPAIEVEAEAAAPKREGRWRAATATRRVAAEPADARDPAQEPAPVREPPKVEPRVKVRRPEVVEEPAPVREPPKVEPRVKVRRPVVEEPAPAEEPPPVEELARAEVRAEPAPKLASVTRIGAQGTNPVWRDRVFNSPRRRPETVTWPRPRPAAANRVDERFDRNGSAAG